MAWTVTYVDREGQEVNIPASDTKNGKALRFRYGLVPDAVAIVDALWEERKGPSRARTAN